MESIILLANLLILVSSCIIALIMALTDAEKKKIQEEEEFRSKVKSDLTPSNRTERHGDKNKIVAALLALFLGGLGIHKFYLGRTGWGIVYLLFCWTFIPAIVGFFEAIYYLVMSEEDFHKKYVLNLKTGSKNKSGSAVKGCLIVFAIVVIGFTLLSYLIGSSSLKKVDQLKSTSTPQTQKTPKGATPEPVLVVDATVLVADYDKNKIAAQEKYTGKTIQTTGYITNISTDITGKYFLSLNSNNDQYYLGTSMACYFADESQKENIMALTKGNSVTVQGHMNDMSLGSIYLDKCVIIK